MSDTYLDDEDEHMRCADGNLLTTVWEQSISEVNSCSFYGSTTTSAEIKFKQLKLVKSE